jgi:hypothetical protein
MITPSGGNSKLNRGFAQKPFGGAVTEPEADRGPRSRFCFRFATLITYFLCKAVNRTDQILFPPSLFSLHRAQLFDSIKHRVSQDPNFFVTIVSRAESVSNLRPA